MRYLTIFLSLAFLVFSASAEERTAAGKPKEIHAAELKALLASGADSVHVFDANGISTRQKEGMVKGASGLSSSSDYNIKDELPSDKNSKLVFYCYNPRCSASHTAAERAAGAGYSDVSVMVDGIIGWKENGGEVQHIMY